MIPTHLTLRHRFDALEPTLSVNTVLHHLFQHQRDCYERGWLWVTWHAGKIELLVGGSRDLPILHGRLASMPAGRSENTIRIAA